MSDHNVCYRCGAIATSIHHSELVCDKCFDELGGFGPDGPQDRFYRPGMADDPTTIPPDADILTLE